MTTLRVRLPVPLRPGAAPAVQSPRVLIDADAGELEIKAPLSSNELAQLRRLAPDDPEWQECIDQLSLRFAGAASGLFPPTLWGDYMKRLQRGDTDAWESFVERYSDAIAASVRGLIDARRQGDVEDFVSEFISWLYLPRSNSSNGRIAERLEGLRLSDGSGERVNRFRGWLVETLRRWLMVKARDESRRVSLQAARIAGDLRQALHEPAGPARRIDEALVRFAADHVLESLRQDSHMHYRALLDMLRDENLEATSQWLAEAHLPASAASASRVRSRARQLFKERLERFYEQRFGGQESDLAGHIPVLATHLAATAEALARDE
jgi:hypothetical protein